MRALKDGGIPLEVYREGDTSAGAVEWGNLVMGRTAGGIFVPLQLLADGSVTATVGGTVTADQGDAGAQAWLMRAASPGAAVALLAENPVAISPAWDTSASQAFLNGVAEPGYDSLRLSFTIVEGTGVQISTVEVLLEVFDGLAWSEPEEALVLTGVPAGGVLLTPSNIRRRTLETAAGGTTTRSFVSYLPGATHYRVSVRETNAAAVSTSVTVSGKQFKQ